MIDREELLRWVDKMDRLIYFRSDLTEDAKKVHEGYMNFFRKHVESMQDKKPLLNVIDGLIFGFAAGLLVATMIRLLG